MVRFKVEAVQLHWVAADKHVSQSRQSSLTSLTGSWPAPIWSLSPLRLCSLKFVGGLPPAFGNPPAAEPWDLACLAGPGVQRTAASWQVVGCPRRRFLSYQQWLPTHCEKPGWWNLDQDQARKWQRDCVAFGLCRPIQKAHFWDGASHQIRYPYAASLHRPWDGDPGFPCQHLVSPWSEQLSG